MTHCTLVIMRQYKNLKMRSKNHFAIKEEGEMKEYVGCKVKRTGKRSLIMYQDDLINKIAKNFREHTQSMHKYEMSAGSGEHIKRPDENEPKISPEDQRKYRSEVGMLLYLVKFSRPDISNTVRELSKVMDGATPAHMKSMLRTIKFVMDTRQRVLNFDLREQEGNQWIL